MNIQYMGFGVTSTVRTYNFHVIDSLHESREFVVEVKMAAFGSTALKYQQAPEICVLRLRRALEEESDGSHAPRRLKVLETDIQEYLQRRQPRRSGAPKGGD